jgi:3-oxoacyl-[acyl-carrier protein] reductase
MADVDRGKRRSGRDVGEAPYAPGLLSRGVAATVATGRVAHQGEGVMKIDFAGKKAIVCGGSRGIGKAIALGFASCGGDVSICARDPKALEETRAEIARLGRKAHAASADLSQGDAVRGYVREAVAALGGVDFLVNNASAFGSSDDDKGWTSNLAVDMLSIVHATQEALPALQKSQGSVVNISSIAAHHPAARQPPYGAIKAAVIHYTVTQAALYAKDRIRVNCIAPGSIEFPGGVWDRRKTDNPALYNSTLASIPFGRMGHAEEIANVALFLASPFASWVTGQAIAVAGGQGL